MRGHGDVHIKGNAIGYANIDLSVRLMNSSIMLFVSSHLIYEGCHVVAKAETLLHELLQSSVNLAEQ